MPLIGWLLCSYWYLLLKLGTYFSSKRSSFLISQMPTLTTFPKLVWCQNMWCWNGLRREKGGGGREKLGFWPEDIGYLGRGVSLLPLFHTQICSNSTKFHIRSYVHAIIWINFHHFQEILIKNTRRFKKQIILLFSAFKSEMTQKRP